MKSIFKIAVFVVVLCALAAAVWGGYRLYRRYAPPGGAGRNMEVRLVAIYAAAPVVGNDSGADSAPGSPAAASSGANPDVDSFQQQDLSAFIASGDAPTGWKWLPVANGLEKEIAGNAPAGAQSLYVTRNSSGRLYLLAADTPDTALTHANSARPWGVDSVQVVNDGMGPAVEIHLDQAGGELMHTFTAHSVGHRIAVVVGGEICEVALVQSPVRSAIVVRLPAGREADAQSLRDALMK